MKNSKNIVVLILLTLSTSVALAQQETAYLFYRQNMNLVNPAYAGLDGKTEVTTTLRRQWTGIANAPVTQAASASTTLGSRVGVGMTLISDKTFVESQNYFSVDVSYRVQIKETANLYFGIKGGGNSYAVNTSGLQTYNIQSDPSLESISTFNYNIGAGAVYVDGPLYISLSVPRFFNTKKAAIDQGKASLTTYNPNIFLSGGYDLPLNASLVLKPSAMVRYVKGAPVSVDLTAMLQLEKNFEIGGMYKTDKAYAAMTTITLNKHFMFGFAYEMNTEAALAKARNTNEFLIKVVF